MADTSVIDASFQIIKFVAYILTFSLVLSGAVLAKSILLLMTSQLAPDRTVSVQMGNLNLWLKLPDVEKYLWIWALMITFSVPEFGALIRSVRIAVFKGYVSEDEIAENNGAAKSISKNSVLLIITAMETLHVVGLAIFVFGILPYIDVAKGVMLTNCVCVIPSVLSKFWAKFMRLIYLFFLSVYRFVSYFISFTL